ncbi:MAG: hypothetical protein AB8E15_00990 [Bdellovibrionales bacterium]
MKFIGAVVLILGLCFVGMKAAWFYGLTKPHIPPKLSFFDGQKSISLRSKPHSLTNYSGNISEFIKSCTDQCYFYFQLYITTDDFFLLLESGQQKLAHLQGEKYKAKNQILLENPKVIGLTQALELNPEAKFIFEINSNTRDIHLKLIEKTKKHYKNIVFHSQFGNIVRAIRSEKPHWNTSLSDDELTTGMMLTNIGLETLASIPTDILILDPVNKSYQNNPKYVAEAQRRSKYVILFSTPEDTEKHKKNNVSTIVVLP